jgi:hypothetical protein
MEAGTTFERGFNQALGRLILMPDDSGQNETAQPTSPRSHGIKDRDFSRQNSLGFWRSGLLIYLKGQSQTDPCHDTRQCPGSRIRATDLTN